MFGDLGVPELLIIFVIALVVFGPRKLPELGRSLGQGIREFKKSMQEITADVVTKIDEDVKQEQMK
jgi:sec-independent protein translocase protein TatA